MSRPRHPIQELEKILQDAESKRWDVRKGKKYYRMRCPCGDHQKSVHLTPTSVYPLNLLGWLRRTGCW